MSALITLMTDFGWRVGSSGYIEIAVREGHAADRMHLHAGELVTLTGVE